jgi:hypothetical protein
MRVLVCGRDYDDVEALSQFMDELAHNAALEQNRRRSEILAIHLGGRSQASVPNQRFV